MEHLTSSVAMESTSLASKQSAKGSAICPIDQQRQLVEVGVALPLGYLVYCLISAVQYSKKLEQF